MSNYIFIILYSILILFMVSLAVLLILLIIKSEKCFNKYIDLEKEKTKNKQYELYSNIDLEQVEKIVDGYFHVAELEYIKFHFTAKNVNYITSAQQMEMIKDVSKQLAINLPESYLFYIRLLRNIDTDEDLIKYIYERVSVLSIQDVADYNKAIE